MSIPFFRRRPKNPLDRKDFRERATRVRSAEGAWPIRGGIIPSREELDAADERIRYYRSLAEQGD